MKTGIKSTQFFKIKKIDGVWHIKYFGYDCMDYQGFMEPDCEIFGYSEKKFSQYFKGIKLAADNCGLEVYQMHGLWPTDDTTEQKRNAQKELFKKQILAAEILGCKNLVVHPCMPTGWQINGNEEEFDRVNGEFWKTLLPFAKEHGVTLCMENMPFRSATGGVLWVKQFVEKTKDENLKACLDTGHANYNGEDVAESIIALGKDLKVVHIHDNNGDTDAHAFPYDGNIDWESAIAAFKKVGFNGCLSLETIVPIDIPWEEKEKTERALFSIVKKWLKKIEE